MKQCSLAIKNLIVEIRIIFVRHGISRLHACTVDDVWAKSHTLYPTKLLKFQIKFAAHEIQIIMSCILKIRQCF